MKLPLELVYWRDAHFSFNDDEDGPDYICATAGFVTKDGRFLKVLSEKLPDGDGYRSATRIPIENVVRRAPLREAH